MKPRISMITLGVRDLSRSVEFYEQGLGFPRMDSPPEVAFFTLDGSWLGLYGREALAEDAAISSVSSGFAGFSLAHNVSSETEVDEVIRLAAAAGATVTQPARKTAWGGYAGYFTDPDGYLWEVAHNPFFWVGPADAAS
ncbi:MAG: VOC family protein [Gammaproteobacteria bacterium]